MVTQPAKRAKKGAKASCPTTDAAAEGMVTDKQRDDFLAWLLKFPAQVKGLDGSQLNKEFFNNLISPGVWLSTEVRKLLSCNACFLIHLRHGTSPHGNLERTS